jgi:hypothetical protein
MIKRWDIINSLIHKFEYKRYLEIGLQSGANFNEVKADYKISVDPDSRSDSPTFLMTSDDFFDQNKETFDIIFIDGLHHADQVYKDIMNSLDILEEGGAIVCHDILPTSRIIQAVPREQDIWTGDCWKAYAFLKGTRPDLQMYVVNTDWGCGLIFRGNQKLMPMSKKMTISKMDWEFFNQKKKHFGIIEGENWR